MLKHNRTTNNKNKEFSWQKRNAKAMRNYRKLMKAIEDEMAFICMYEAEEEVDSFCIVQEEATDDKYDEYDNYLSSKAINALAKKQRAYR